MEPHLVSGGAADKRLLAACRTGQHQVVEELLKGGIADPNLRDDDNEIAWTPLFLAARSCHVETVQVLLSHGADVNARSKMDQSPLHAVCWSKQSSAGLTQVVRLLLEAGAHASAGNRRGQTPLHWAAHYGHVGAVRLLVQYSALIAARNEDGETPLDKVMGRMLAPTAATHEICRILQSGRGGLWAHLAGGSLPTAALFHPWHARCVESLTSVHEAKLYYSLLRKLVATRVCKAPQGRDYWKAALGRVVHDWRTQAANPNTNASSGGGSFVAATDSRAEWTLTLLLQKAVQDDMMEAAEASAVMVSIGGRPERGDADSSLTSEGPEQPSDFCSYCATAARAASLGGGEGGSVNEHWDGSTQALQNAMGLLFQKMMVLNLDDKQLLVDTCSRSTISLERQHRLEIQLQALVSMMRGILNAILRGTDEADMPAFERICSRVMDWADLDHVRACISEESPEDCAHLLGSYNEGIQLAIDVADNVEDEATGQRLDSVFVKKDGFLLLGMIAAMGQPDYGKIDDDHTYMSNAVDDDRTFVSGADTLTAAGNEVTSSSGDDGGLVRREGDSPSGADAVYGEMKAFTSSSDLVSAAGVTSNPAGELEESSGSSDPANSDQSSRESGSATEPVNPRKVNPILVKLREGHANSERRMEPIAEVGEKTKSGTKPNKPDTAPFQRSDTPEPLQRFDVLQVQDAGGRTGQGSGSTKSTTSLSKSNYKDPAVKAAEEIGTVPSNDSTFPSSNGSASHSGSGSGALFLCKSSRSAYAPSWDAGMHLRGVLPKSQQPAPQNAFAMMQSSARRRGAMPSTPDVLREIYPDARLSEDDEDELVLHASVKFGDIDLIKDQLMELSVEELNGIDSCGRTAMDLAALTGQTEVVNMLESKGGKFSYKRRGPMLALARLRSLYVPQYLKLVEEEV
jgi:ankyrin repeat protein